jgi:tagatose-1,6-bisphosphate aldolase
VQIAETQPDLIKIEYPGSAKGCRRIREAGQRSVGRACRRESGSRSSRTSCASRATRAARPGFIAGRSIWKEAVGSTAQPVRSSSTPSPDRGWRSA